MTISRVHSNTHLIRMENGQSRKYGSRGHQGQSLLGEMAIPPISNVRIERCAVAKTVPNLVFCHRDLYQARIGVSFCKGAASRLTRTS